MSKNILIKPLIAFVIIILVLIGLYSTGVISFRNTIKDIKIGEYVSFGKFDNSPILWIVVNKGPRGIGLVSDKILCFKAFDAAESGIARNNGNPEGMGRSTWKDSNLREWLNCIDLNVKYSTQAPIKSAVWLGQDPYDSEPGFLSNFESKERSCIAEVSHDGITDKVYLLSEDEIKRSKMPSKQATPSLLESFSGNSSDNDWTYWSRTFSKNGHNDVVLSNSSNMFPCNSLGVAPAVTLKTSSHIYKGTGALSDPYAVSR